ncbi:outer membrane protein assembly factor BamC [Aliiglaciecola sp. CAU 1673]|uniref:outer membrane protein assembly factor BamC n=1 Tax=Aliiglaciecola sp. CAU 1673 TaxID=3032595 RepID=UPI0023DA4787|nr:outer membrane protein assembly factor BamC [Aliiglaciecola sp. CAU 1673]MDF2177553.1 outer membrane protein assembly factor BamC [Aliiglaciecola sp. CAU 1673]
MSRNALSVLVLVGVLSACTTQQERRIANGDFRYLDEQQRVNVRIPENLSSPAFTKDYAIPALGEQAPRQLIGDKLEVRSPALVLPLVTGSHVEEGKRSATVFFDQVDDSTPLDTAIWNSLISFLDEQGIGVDTFDKQQGLLLTDWMVATEEEGSWYSWTKTERELGRRFEFKLNLKPHGRTASLDVSLRDYMETRGDKVISSADLDSEAVRRNEVEVLNSVIGHYQQQLQLADAKRMRLIREGMEMEMGFNANGDPAFIVSGDYDLTWTRLQLVLRKLGFNVKDLDKSNGLLFVKYEGPQSSWWSRLWGNDDSLPLDQEEYRLQVNRQGGVTAVTFMDEESKPLAADLMTQLYNPFSQTMADDDLDI